MKYSFLEKDENGMYNKNCRTISDCENVLEYITYYIENEAYAKALLSNERNEISEEVMQDVVIDVVSEICRNVVIRGLSIINKYPEKDPLFITNEKK